MEALEKHSNAFVICCDLSKAFDCVLHENLLIKLEYLGIKVKSLNFFGCIWMNIALNNSKPDLKVIKHGVPQG